MQVRHKDRLLVSLAALIATLTVPQTAAAQSDNDRPRPREDAVDNRLEISIIAKVSQLDWDQFYLGQEAVGSATPEIDQVGVNQDLDVYALAAQVQFPLADGAPLDYIRVSGGFSEGSRDSLIGDFDPVSDNRFLLPGPEGGASGLSLGDAPGFSNTATNLSNEIKIDERFLEVAIPMISSGEGGFAAIEVLGGFRTADYSSNFRGNLPGYEGDFVYTTGVDFTQSYIGSRFQASIHVTRSTRAPSLSVLFTGRAEITNYDASGEDDLAWSVFNGGTTGGGRTELDKNDVVLDGSLEAGVRLRVIDMVIEVTAGAERRHVPRIVRDGTNPSTIELIDSIGAHMRASLTMPF